ncbi:hypothetical protein GBW32_19245 [Streptomyces tsukubensis]|nr:hypothetical protein GBW32_19245 [Streptomyces tsukubensis]
MPLPSSLSPHRTGPPGRTGPLIWTGPLGRKGPLGQRRRDRIRASLRRAAPALLAYTAVRLCGALVALLACLILGLAPYDKLLELWDASWYQHIAAHGYGYEHISHRRHLVYRDLAFFPLYPGLVRALSAALPVSFPVAALLVSWVSGLAAAWGIHAVVERLRGRSTAIALVVLWAALPHAVVLSVPYSEALLTALAAWSLHALLSGRWIWAGALAALAGLSRPNGVAVAAAVGLTGLWVLWQRHRRAARGARSPGSTERPPPRPATARVWGGILLAPAGWVGYVLYVGARQGDVLGGYFAVQHDWGSSFDFGLRMSNYVDHISLDSTPPARLVAVLVVMAGLALFTLLLTPRWQSLPGALLVYVGVLLLIAVGGSSYVSCKPRFLLPAFPLLLPPAVRLVRTAKTRPKAATAFVVTLAGSSVLYGAYLVTLGGAAL